MSCWRREKSIATCRALWVALALCLTWTAFWPALAAEPAPPNEPGNTRDEHPFPNRRKAPSLDGAVGWINADRPVDLKDLRGKFVVLDFWTYCCINCMHVLPELKKLERSYPHNVVVIGVHTAKFSGEKDNQNIADAVSRHEIEHPVANDANQALWDKFEANSWPSIRIIDPEGYLVAADSGEVEFATFDAFFKRALPYYRSRGLLNEEPIKFCADTSRPPTALRYPGKVLADEATGRLFVADSNHNRIVISSLEGKLIDVAGSGAIGTADGAFAEATFHHPQGMALQGESLYVADTENHMLRRLNLKTRTVATVAGTGHQARGLWPGVDPKTGAAKRFVGPPRGTALNSPWALWVHDRDLFIAMAGSHQIWKMGIDGREIGPFAGNGREDIVDGPLLPKLPYDLRFASFAQPSGLASDGVSLFVADSEGSSIRALPFDPQGEATTIVGTAGLPSARLFTFGDTDGQGAEVRLQHALGVTWNGGLLYVADTYNNKIKVIDLKTKTCRTLAGDGTAGASDAPARFDEPAGLSYAAGKLYVSDTNNHLVRMVDIKWGQVNTLSFVGLKAPLAASHPAALAQSNNKRPNFDSAKPIDLLAAKAKTVDGKLLLDVQLTLPPGYKLNPAAPMRYWVESASEQGAIDRSALGKLTGVNPPEENFRIELPASASGDDMLKIWLSVYYCQDQENGVCKATSVLWTLPVAMDPSAADDAVGLPFKAE